MINMIRKKVDSHLVLLAIVTLGMSAVIFYRIAAKGYFYIEMGGDIFQQYIHFFNMFHDLVRSGEMPFWSWNYGPGGSFWNDFGYYMLGDIFIWPLLLFPKSWFPFSFIPISILKIFLISLGTYLLLKKLGVKRGIALMAGIANSYALFNFEHFYTHYFFLNATVYFPFILLGYERFLSDKKADLLLITLFFASISNFYFLFMITIGLFFYSIFRYFTSEKTEKSIKAFLLFHIKLSGFYLLSLGAAMVIFLPSVYSFLQSSVFHRHGQPVLDNVLSLDELVRRLLWKGGMNVLPLLVVPLLFINRVKHSFIYGLMGFVLLAMFVFQDIYSVIAGFSSPLEFRALFLFNTLFLVLAALALNGLDFKKKKNIISLLILSVLVTFWLDKNSFTHYGAYIKWVPIVFAIFFLVAQFLKEVWLRRAVFSFAALAIIVYSFLIPYSFVTDLLFRSSGGIPGPYHKGVWGTYPLMSKGEYYNYYNNQIVWNALSPMQGDKGLYRETVSYPGGLANNSSMSYGYRSYSTYQSLLKWELQAFEMDDLAQPGSRSLSVTYGFPNNTFLTTILNNKYHVSINDSPTHLYGYETIAKNGNSVVEKNQFALPIGFLYHSAMTASSFQQSDFPGHDELMLRNAVVSKSVLTSSGLDADKKLSVKTIGSLAEAEFDQKTTVLKKQKQGILVESKTPIELTIPVKKHELSEMNVFADIIPYTPNQGITINATSNLGQNYVFEKNMKFNQYQIYQYHYRETTNKVLFRFGKDDQTEWVKLVIQPGKFLVKDVRVSISDYQDYENIVKHYEKDSLKNIKYGNNYVEGSYSSAKKGILFLSIPYSSGWRATVDGEDVKTFPVHSAFTGIQAPSGKHLIKLTFTPEGFIPGLVISILSICMALFIVIRGKKRERTSI